MSNSSTDKIEIVNDREKQNKVIRSMMEYLYGWMDDNPGIRSSIVDSINYNIAYVEVFFFNHFPTDLHVKIMNEADEEDWELDEDFENAFNTLQSSFDNIIFNK